MKENFSASPLNDLKVEAVLDRLHYAANRQLGSLLIHYLPKLSKLVLGQGMQFNRTNTNFYNDKYIPIDRDQGHFLYLLGRLIKAKTIVEFGTSFGILTIYLAAAVRDNGGGIVIGTEIVAEKVIQAKQNMIDSGLDKYVEIREGDALKTLRNLCQPVDLLLMDGWAHLAIEVLKIVDPHIRSGGVIVSDNIRTFKPDLKEYVKFLRNPVNGYCSTTIDLKGGTEISIKLR